MHIENACKSLIEAIIPRLRHLLSEQTVAMAICDVHRVHINVFRLQREIIFCPVFYYAPVQPASFLPSLHLCFSPLNRVPWDRVARFHECKWTGALHTCFNLADVAVRKVLFVTNRKEMKNLRWENVL